MSKRKRNTKESPPPPYAGSLDPFEDITELLDKLNVVYSLSIGMFGQNVTHTWTNVGPSGVEQIRKAINSTLDEIR